MNGNHIMHTQMTKRRITRFSRGGTNTDLTPILSRLLSNNPELNHCFGGQAGKRAFVAICHVVYQRPAMGGVTADLGLGIMQGVDTGISCWVFGSAGAVIHRDVINSAATC
jgi:hypothetical protein